MTLTLIEHEAGKFLREKQYEPEHICVKFDEDGNIFALSWRYTTEDQGLYQMAKRRGGTWSRSDGGWTFENSKITAALFDAIVKRHPEWPVIGHPDKPFKPLAGTKVSRIPLDRGLEAYLIQLPVPYFSQFDEMPNARIFRFAGKDKNAVALVIDSAHCIAKAVESMCTQGAICDNTLAKKWKFTSAIRKPLVSAKGWAVQITCDLSSPIHCLLAPEQKYRWEGNYPFGTKIAIAWDGKINLTRKQWPGFESKFQELGIAWDGDDPDAELATPSCFDDSQVAGWESPAPNGHLMHPYQKEGARFCASRGMRALIGDEMGVGKTAQAIAAAEGTNAQRILVICPANARYVWEREIEGWGGRGRVQHITTQLDKLDMDARWHIVTYDLISVQTETWLLNNENEEKAFTDAFPELKKSINRKRGGGYPCKVRLEKPLITVPQFSDSKRVAAWVKMMRRLRGELLEQLLSCGELLVILDEAHRAKNKMAKRTKAIQRLTEDDNQKQLLMLTGTPLRNNEHESAVLLGLLDSEVSKLLTVERGYTIQDVKDYLNYFMIRRIKSEILPQLPDKTRQRIDIADLDPRQMSLYHSALESARDSYERTLELGRSEVQARQSMQGGIEQARTALGIAKVRGGDVADFVVEVVENKECCVVFCAHHQVSDDLQAQLILEGLRVAVVDGRMSQRDRARTVDDFQNGRLDVFIGGINSASESITLTRADTLIFVELDWVPAALLQAEDRIHRVGQRSNCQIIQLVARMDEKVGENLDEVMVELIGSKLARIGTVLGEETSNIIAGGIQVELQNRLLRRKA